MDDALSTYSWQQHTTNAEENGCGERGSNTRPSDLQSDALPTELSPLDENATQY